MEEETGMVGEIQGYVSGELVSSKFKQLEAGKP